MWKKLLILSLFISVIFVFSAPISPVNAGSKNVNWEVAGSIANYVMVLDTTTSGLVPNFLISLSAKGSPGEAEITLMGVGVPISDYNNNDPCDKLENILQVDFIQNDMVARFPDLSLLFARIIPSTSYLCVDTSTGISTFHAEMEFFKGTGRFEGVTGGSIMGDGTSYAVGNSLAGEVGTIKGNIIY